MKLATLKDGSRDGRLVVVSRDLTQCVPADGIAATLQAALDRWAETAPKLQALSERLNAGEVEGALGFDPVAAMAPLPRAYQWADGSAYVNHVELVRKARGAEMPENIWHDPLMYQGVSDRFIGPMDDVECPDEAFGIDFEAEVAVVTDDVAMSTAPDQAGGHIVLVMLVNDVSLRNLIPGELGKGFGFFQAKPASSFSPVAVTPDELGDAWDGAKVNLPLRVWLNDTVFGAPEAGEDMTFDFPRLIAHAARTRHLGAGTIIGSGTVSNLDRSRGSCCIAERRMLESIDAGRPETPFMSFGDRVRIEMTDRAGHSIFGAIDQTIGKWG
ncbi:2-keto-4-pentenoate hydratase [Tistrella bauzanensis]|uniref:2-keto-4-pentenoate hydratase n=1 Tax=Tistrella bauzanensis TaxID=657419 RepID=A0ABQ1IGX3_9PROT|nr:fumarylacetoacetate hydrolase family protein [Tistrella bauzanensis]GGB40071.1 2-keto-4-pentenoate hydratase [Tistrella bauzanensis]